MFAIETQGLGKDYGKLAAVKGLSLTVEEGSVYGFLGPNGAGKSTTIKMLMGFVKPTRGTASIFGMDVQEKRYDIMVITGYLPERPAFYEGLTGKENLLFFSRLLDVKDPAPRIEELIATVGLEGRGDDKVKAYSHGMRQRLGIAISLLGAPKLLILDEPTTGLDPQGSHDIRELIKKLRDEKVTILLSSHLLYEVQEICDHVGIIKKGELIVEKPMQDFLRGIGGSLSKIEISAAVFEPLHIDAAKAVKGVVNVAVEDGKLVVDVTSSEVAQDLNIALVSSGCRVMGIKEIMPSLEDAFLKVTGEGR